jgi:glutamine synthetase
VSGPRRWGAPRPVGPRSLAARAAAARTVEPHLGQEGNVLLLAPDPHARFAAVELAGPFFAEEVLRGGYGVCSYVFAWDVHREALGDPELDRYLGGFGDLRMRPDLASATRLPDSVAVVCDVEWPSGSPVEVAPRQVLATQLRALEALDLVPSAGIEHEVILADGQGAPLSGHGVDYAVGGTERMAPVVTDVRTALDHAGLGVESARAECHPGQYEIVLRHRDALAACDDAMLQQLLVRRIAAEHGCTAGYLAAPQPGQGNSCHVHLSLSGVSPESGTALPPVLGSFLAGVLRDARAFTAIWAPTWNSYVRLRTAPFSPRALRWGVDDRTAAVRVAGRGGSLRLEFRFAGADAQVHLVVAALLAAGRAGITDRLSPPPAGEVVGELARTPWEALDALLEGRAAALLGDEVVAHQSALLRAELEAGCDAVTDWQRARGALRS